MTVRRSSVGSVGQRGGHLRASFPALLQNQLGVGERTAQYFTSGQIPTAANRWGGKNRGGWSDPEYEGLYAAFSSTLERSERDRLMIRMMAFVSERLPGFQNHFRFDIVPYERHLHAPAVVNPDTRVTWDIHL